MPELILLRHQQCKTHPRNMRRFYPLTQVNEMAQSIKDYGGLVHALQVTPADEPDTYFVVDGNFRLQGARRLGDSCPPLKAEVVDRSQVEQLLTMIVANTFRYDVDPISEAMHYRVLHDEEGLTYEKISERTGVYFSRVMNHVLLLDLDEPIQELIAEGRFTKDPAIARQLLKINNADARVKLVQKLVAQKAGNKAVKNAIETLIAHLNSSKAHSQIKTPMIKHASDKAGPGATLPPEDAITAFPVIREAAKLMCHECDIYADLLQNQASEPAWTLVVHAADLTCRDCAAREIATACRSCPGVELIRRLIVAAKEQKEITGA